MFDKKVWSKEHYQTNKEQVNASYKEYYQKNKEHIKVSKKEYYQKNKEKRKASDKEYAQKYKARRRVVRNKRYLSTSLLWAYLIPKYKEDPCMDCGTVYPFHVMQFDHRPGEIKDFGISTKNCRTASTKNINMIEAEIQKCDFVCANCHSDRTWQRRHNGD